MGKIQKPKRNKLLSKNFKEILEFSLYYWKNYMGKFNLK